MALMVVGGRVSGSAELDQGEGVREGRVSVKFVDVNPDAKFSAVPTVLVSISKLDFRISGPTPRNPRLKVTAEKVTKQGCDIVFTTWADTLVAAVDASWIAIGDAPVHVIH